MSKHIYREIKEMLCEELEAMTKNGTIRTKEDLDIIDKLTHSIKSIETIIAMNETYGESGAYPSQVRYGHRTLADRSNAPRRDSMGRYSRDGDMIAELHELMERAKDEHTRVKFQRFIEDLEAA